MKKQVLLALAAATFGLGFATDALAQRKSGRDAFGYTWLRDDTTGGPTYNWVDISTTGVQATGMGDDNVIGPINLGFDFVYYWNTYNQVYIGSNGYIMFGRGDNVASGNFPTPGMPPFPYAADNKQNFIGGFVSDLTFIKNNGTQANANTALYHETQGNKFIATWSDVAYWNGNTAGEVSGSHTFQIILDAADSSFTIQHQTHTGTAYSGYTGIKHTYGFEDINGVNGASFGRNLTNAQLNNHAYKADYPAQITLSLTDFAVEGIYDLDNTARFKIAGDPNNYVQAIVRNAGTVDLTGSFDVNLSMEDANGNIVSSGAVTINGLPRGGRSVISLPTAIPTNTPAGTYLIQVTSNVAGDVQAANNNLSGEVVLIDTTGAEDVYGYDNPIYGANQNFTGYNFGVYYDFPSYATIISGLQFDMGWVNDDDYTDSSKYIFTIHRPLASNPTIPGPAVDTVRIEWSTSFDGDSIAPLNLSNVSNVGPIRRHTLMFTNPIAVTEGGVFIGAQFAGPRQPGFFWNRVMADTVAPFSRRVYEIQGGTWGPDRNRDSYDFAVRLVTSTLVTANKTEIPRAVLTAFPNPATESVTLQDKVLNQIASVTVVDINGRVVLTAPVTQVSNNTMVLPVHGLKPGAYVVRGTGKGGSFTTRFVKN